MLRLNEASVKLGGRKILDGVSLSVERGELVALLGPNGSGKSTLLRLAAGLVRTCEGNCELGGRAAYMPQDSGEGAPLTIRQAVLLGRVGRLGLRLREDDLAAADSWIGRIGLKEIAGRRLDRISGGQRQLSYLAQAMMREPALLLLDEPTSALDLSHQLAFAELARELTVAARLATVVAMHDIGLAARIADRVIVISEGRVVANGRPGEVITPGMMARIFKVDAELIGDDHSYPALRLNGRLRPALSAPPSPSGRSAPALPAHS
jgi:iron complex transport system ATP-binding protein